jgi:hypothetical protein
MVHIGKIIEQKISESGFSKSYVAEKINRSPQTLYDIFQKPNINTDLLLQLGEVLNYDFFQHYINPKNASVKIENVNTPTISITINNIPELKFNKIYKQLNEILK